MHLEKPSSPNQYKALKNSPAKVSIKMWIKYCAMIIFIVAPFVSFYVGMQYQKQRNNSSTDSINKSAYYQNLRDQCNSQQSKGCCLASVSSMEAGTFKLAENGNCPAGFKKNMMLCIDSFTWCEPFIDSTQAGTNQKTMNDAFLGFQFDYPDTWNLEKINYDSPPCTAISCDTSMGYVGVLLEPNDETLFRNSGVRVYKVANNGRSIKEYFNEKDYSCCGDDAEPNYLGDRIIAAPIVEVNNHEAYSLTHPPIDNPLNQVTEVNWTIVEKDNQIYVIEVIKDIEANSQQFEEAVAQILSSFKFFDNSIVDGNKTICDQVDGIWREEYSECEFVSEDWCLAHNGTYQSCASACRHDSEYPNAVCTRQCVLVCSFN